jgi:hypothetical protein
MNLFKRLSNIALTFSVFFFTATSVSTSYAQFTFDTIYINIDFENGLDSIITFSNDTAGTSWQIGQPSKPNFSEAVSLPNAIMTDTLNPVQINTNTWFEVPFIPGDYDSVSFYGFCPLQLCFTHRLEQPSLSEAAAWIDIRDNDEHYNLVDLNSGFHGNYYAYNAIQSQNSYLSWQISFNGEPGFNISMSETETCYQLYGFSAGVPPNSGIHDTVFFRFNFATSSFTDPIWEGWLIDDILIGRGIGWSCGTEGLNDEDQMDVIIYPNPVTEKVSIQLPFPCSKGNAYIEDMYGSVVFRSNIQNSDFLSIDISMLNAGTYILKLESGGHLTIKKIIKL